MRTVMLDLSGSTYAGNHCGWRRTGLDHTHTPFTSSILGPHTPPIPQPSPFCRQPQPPALQPLPHHTTPDLPLLPDTRTDGLFSPHPGCHGYVSHYRPTHLAFCPPPDHSLDFHADLNACSLWLPSALLPYYNPCLPIYCGLAIVALLTILDGKERRQSVSTADKVAAGRHEGSTHRQADTGQRENSAARRHPYERAKQHISWTPWRWIWSVRHMASCASGTALSR